jgi:hypothetical protein
LEVSFVDQSKFPGDVVLKLTVPPWQNVVAPEALICGVAGEVFCVTETGREFIVHPLASVKVTK